MLIVNFIISFKLFLYWFLRSVSTNFLKESDGKYCKVWDPEDKNQCCYMDAYIIVLKYGLFGAKSAIKED